MQLITLLALASAVQAHYRFSKLNDRSNAGVPDVNSSDMRFYQARGGTGTATVAAGDVLGFVANAAVTHFGPVQFYMAKVPDGADIDTWDPAGNGGGGGAKIGSITATKKTINTTIPASVPSGLYLIRIESIALHPAQSVGGAQIYLSRAQVKVTGGGSGTPGPLVAFPGAYEPTDPGLRWSYYPVPTTYTAPGPAVWEG
ncbi:glycoside hydrolase family 61 protein [Hypoxylon sp. FL0890]|nr:glycoside hydrolase family 61 protein [Hypoxylon sp. FL0890]